MARVRQTCSLCLKVVSPLAPRVPTPRQSALLPRSLHGHQMSSTAVGSSSKPPIDASASAGLTTDAVKPKKISPYRLLSSELREELLPPLRASGWDVKPLLPSSGLEHGPLQEELMSVFEFRHERGKEAAKEAWRRTLRFVQDVGEIVEREDHHPTITITPDGCGLGFSVKIQTHTHTPMPIPNSSLAGSKPPPNLTKKDTNLASAISSAYTSLR